MTPPLIERVSEGVCWLTLNRPASGNALSAELVADLHEAVCRHRESGIRSLVLRGEGRHFCTGFDLSGLDEESDASLLHRFIRIELLLQDLHAAPFETVAWVQGRVMGAGADLFAACRRRLIQGEASFAFPGAAGFGLVLGTHRLAARVGVERAADWTRSGRVIDSKEALRTGLASGRVQDGDGETSLTGAPPGPSSEGVIFAGLHRALHQGDDPERDLGLLVRSAAEPGLKKRIQTYVQMVRARRP